MERCLPAPSAASAAPDVTDASQFPADWPGPGPIDLDVHDLPHESSTTEWWYVNTHVRTASGRPLSLFVAFFRIIHGKDEASGAPIHAHSVTWALTDPGSGMYRAVSRVDQRAPQIGLDRIDAGRGPEDPRLTRAIREVLEKGRVPLPDRLFEGEVFVNKRRLELDYDGNRFHKDDQGQYVLHLWDAKTSTGCDLVLSPRKPPIRHGDNGVVQGTVGENMFYYFIPRCEVRGTVTVGGTREQLASGSGWYDHEFGCPPAKQDEGDDAGGGNRDAGPTLRLADDGTPATKDDRSDYDVAWNWASVQLEDGSDVTAYALVRVDNGEILGQWAILVGPNGERSCYDEMDFTPLSEWRSTRTFYRYPVTWRLHVPKARLDLELQAAVTDQEFITVISQPAFWEGRVDAKGTLAGRPAAGIGYVERSGFEQVKTLDQFFSAVGEEVRRSVAAVLPLQPGYEVARDLIANERRAHYMDGVDLAQLGRTLFAPVREITDRGGKSWRSYAALACCDVVEGDSRRFVQWLAMPELMHVGSLIVDDVQDRSTVRRGGPAAHLIYGEPLAINAGTAAYFVTQHLLQTGDVSPASKLVLYDLYFEAMRAGHAGQAIDLGGVDDLMESVVESGDTAELERRVLACHRLKTAAPAGALARMGAVAGGGSQAQIDAVGSFFEALGLAFQIVDDVLNLRGFKGDLKSRGEDLRNGTVTYPVAKAMACLSRDERATLWSRLSSRSDDDALVYGMVEKIEACGAMDECLSEARNLVEDAWTAAEPALADSTAKVMLRSFGWYVLERHY